MCMAEWCKLGKTARQAFDFFFFFLTDDRGDECEVVDVFWSGAAQVCGLLHCLSDYVNCGEMV